MIIYILVMADIIIPCIGSHYFDCRIFVKLFWFLHPVLNYLSLYTMIFMRQYFTFRALRETRLKNFIPLEIPVISVRPQDKINLIDVGNIMKSLSPTSKPCHQSKKRFVKSESIFSLVYHLHSVLFFLDSRCGCSLHQTIW